MMTRDTNLRSPIRLANLDPNCGIPDPEIINTKIINFPKERINQKLTQTRHQQQQLTH